MIKTQLRIELGVELRIELWFIIIKLLKGHILCVYDIAD